MSNVQGKDYLKNGSSPVSVLVVRVLLATHGTRERFLTRMAVPLCAFSHVS